MNRVGIKSSVSFRQLCAMEAGVARLAWTLRLRGPMLGKFPALLLNPFER